MAGRERRAGARSNRGSHAIILVVPVVDAEHLTMEDQGITREECPEASNTLVERKIGETVPESVQNKHQLVQEPWCLIDEVSLEVDRAGARHRPVPARGQDQAAQPQGNNSNHVVVTPRTCSLERVRNHDANRPELHPSGIRLGPRCPGHSNTGSPPGLLPTLIRRDCRQKGSTQSGKRIEDLPMSIPRASGLRT